VLSKITLIRKAGTWVKKGAKRGGNQQLMVCPVVCALNGGNADV